MSRPATATRSRLSGCSKAQHTDMFRALVVVPKSHVDGTHECIRPQSDDIPSINNMLEFTLAQFSKDQQNEIAAQAIALDVRGAARSVWLVWDARTLHQGHLFVGGEMKSGKDFAPKRVFPVIHSPKAVKQWRRHLDEHGYVAVGPVLDETEVDMAAKLLVKDVNTMTGIKRKLTAIADEHLPNHANTGLRHRGLPHGEFAWFLRCRPALLKLWQKLYGGQQVVGVPTSVAISPHRDDVVELTGSMNKYFSKSWLHLDYSPPCLSACTSLHFIFFRRRWMLSRGLEWAL